MGDCDAVSEPLRVFDQLPVGLLLGTGNLLREALLENEIRCVMLEDRDELISDVEEPDADIVGDLVSLVDRIALDDGDGLMNIVCICNVV